jgi:predicted transposase/invertase (TIGR01784 family)
MQILPTENIFERVCFYKSEMVVEQLGKGQNYDRIKKVINIVITDFIFIESTDAMRYHHCFRLYDPQDKTYFGDVEEIHALELPKLPAKSDNTAIWDWMKYIGVGTEEDLTMLAGKNEVLRHAVDELYRVSANDEVQQEYKAREKAWRDEQSRMAYAVNQATKKAKAEANAESNAKIAQLETENERLRRELARFQQNHD